MNTYNIYGVYNKCFVKGDNSLDRYKNKHKQFHPQSMKKKTNRSSFIYGSVEMYLPLTNIWNVGSCIHIFAIK